MNTTLLIDGNWLLMSRLFAVKSYFNVQNDDEEKQKDFENVRGVFNNNPFVLEVKDHILKKESLAVIR